MQERRLAASGVHVTGATEVMEVLRRGSAAWLPKVSGSQQI